MNRQTKFKQTEIGKIPEDWEVVRLGDSADDFIGGGTPSTSNPDYWNGKVAWMTSAHIDGKLVVSGQRYITEKGLNESSTHLIPKGNLLVSTRVGIGKAAINSIDIAISQDLTGVILKKDKTDVEFVYWFLLNNSSKLKSLAQGSTIKGLLKDDLANLQIPFPPLPEQRAIASVLGTVGSAIQKVNEAIEKTGRLKRGLMQKLLTKGIGHKKFKASEVGWIPEEWEVVRLGDAIEELKSGFASGKRDENGIVQIRMNNVTTDGRLMFKSYLKVPAPENIDPWLLKKDDFLFNNTNSIDLVGKSTIFNDAPFPCTFSNHFTRIRFKKELLLPELILYHFLILWEKGYFKSVAIRHVGQSAVHTNYLLKLKIPLPPLPEQRRIAEILGTVDRKLELERARKGKLERLKKGLMDELLTGKKRIKMKMEETT